MITTAPRPGTQAWNFVRHYLEMCIAMCIGGGLLLAGFFWAAAQVGQPALREQAPELAVLAAAVIFALPMAAWMLFRGMEKRPTAEMAGATIAVGLVLIALAWAGILPADDLSGWASARFCGPACLVMVPVMLARRGMYAGHAGHGGHQMSPAAHSA